MDLTAQELAAVENGALVKYSIPESHVECVVVRVDLLDSFRVPCDFSACDADELARLTSEVLEDEDWNTSKK